MDTGLSHNSVLCVEQDLDGYIWAGTRDGLNRYDGVNFSYYTKQFGDTTSLSNNHINCLYVAKNGDLWVGTASGLNWKRRGENHFRQFNVSDNQQSNVGNYVRTITETHAGMILAGTSTGIIAFNPGNNQLSYAHIPHVSLRNLAVVSILEDRHSNIWLGTRNGLYIWDVNEFKKVCLDRETEINSTEFEVREIIEDEQGDFWVATENHGLYRFRLMMGDPYDIEHYHTGNSGILTNKIRKIQIMDDNTIWLGTFDGLCVFDISNKTFQNIRIELGPYNDLSSYSIRAIFKDDQGGVWLGTYAGGLLYYHNQNNLFSHFRVLSDIRSSISGNVVAGFHENDQGQLWIATEGGGLFLYDPITHESVNFTSIGTGNTIASNNVKTIVTDQLGNLWIGTINGLHYFDLESNGILTYRYAHDNPNCLANNQVHALYVDSQDMLWIGTNGGGVQMFDKRTKSFTHVEGINQRNINVIHAASNARLWIGSQSGLECYDTQLGKAVNMESYFYGMPVGIQYVQCIYEDIEGIIWVGTLGYGLFAIKDNKVNWFEKSNGFPDNTVNSILQDNNGRFWLTTNKGLSRVDFSTRDDDIELLSSRTFTVSQGLQGQQFYPGAALKSSTGAFYFGGNNGVNAFFPEEIKDFEFFPDVVIESFVIGPLSRTKETIRIIDNVNMQEKVVLPYWQRNMSISFTGINLINPGQTIYRYQLGNQDTDWVYIGSQRTINFNFLPAGLYELRIQASTSDGKWPDHYKSLRISVLPPWWVTKWAFTLYFLMIGLLLFVFFLFSQRWARLKNELAMEHFQREKEKELHQVKLRFFTDVSHELRTPLTLILSPIERIIDQPGLSNKLRNQLTMIQRNGRRMMQLVNKVLDLRRLEAGHDRLSASYGNLVDFVREISYAFEGSASVKSIDFVFDTDLPSLDLYFDREKMEIVLYNLLSNALKNTSSGGRISLSLEVVGADHLASCHELKCIAKSYAVIGITDNGKGIPTEIINKIFNRFYTAGSSSVRSPLSSGVGLELSKRMVELHKGIITAESHPESKRNPRVTRFKVFLPLGKDHLSEHEIQAASASADDQNGYQSLFDPSEFVSIEEDITAGNEMEAVELPETQIGDIPHMLIVEDNSEVRSFIRTLFDEDFRVLEAENGEIGLSLAFSGIPDLIVCDVMMPVMNGMEFCRRIKSDIRTSHIPVIMLTAQTAITFKYEGLETGADDYITKPFNPNYLLIKAKNLMRQRGLMRQHFHHEAICNPENTPVTSLDEKFLRKTVDYIIENIESPTLNVESLSSHMGMSRVHFYRKIKALTNYTAVEFIRSIRLKRAAWLIEKHTFHIKEVRQMVGFEDASYFRDAFVKQFGVTPSDYASNQQKDIDANQSDFVTSHQKDRQTNTSGNNQ